MPPSALYCYNNTIYLAQCNSTISSQSSCNLLSINSFNVSVVFSGNVSVLINSLGNSIAGLSSDASINIPLTTFFYTNPASAIIQSLLLISPDANSTVIAGTPNVPGYNDGTFPEALFDQVNAISYVNGNLYVIDIQRYSGSLLRKLDLTSQMVTTICGSATNNGTLDGRSALFILPSSFIIDVTEHVGFILDAHHIRKVILVNGTYDNITSVVSMYAGSNIYNFAGTVDGNNSTVLLNANFQSALPQYIRGGDAFLHMLVANYPSAAVAFPSLCINPANEDVLYFMESGTLQFLLSVFLLFCLFPFGAFAKQ